MQAGKNTKNHSTRNENIVCCLCSVTVLWHDWPSHWETSSRSRNLWEELLVFSFFLYLKSFKKGCGVTSGGTTMTSAHEWEGFESESSDPSSRVCSPPFASASALLLTKPRRKETQQQPYANQCCSCWSLATAQKLLLVFPQGAHYSSFLLLFFFLNIPLLLLCLLLLLLLLPVGSITLHHRNEPKRL